MIETHPWEPFRIFNSLDAHFSLGMTEREFAFRFIQSLRSLPVRTVLNEKATAWRNNIQARKLVGVHLRRTDRAAHHRQQFRAFLMRKQGLNRELPLYLNIMYGVLPQGMVHFVENTHIMNMIKKYGADKYAVFSDSMDGEASFSKMMRVGKIKKVVPVQDNDNQIVESNLRKTNIEDAMIELLCLSKCDAIAQSNRASTFSLVAAMIGGKPILTPETRYPFYHSVKAEMGMPPNSAVLKG
ncbi:hypothetical protein [Hyphococcus sp. DH-69]|uniref:hypothetical protein n=1 Tax=Hyphococcus formosus TaxID=3143534 RepID=UPI00398B8B4A